MDANSRGRAQERMVQVDLMARGIHDARVLDAMRSVPRDEFVLPEMRDQAYADSPLPIGQEQTISQPFIVAYMATLAELRDTDRVLEIGTGSGYAAAVFCRLSGEVYTVERHAALAARARETFARLGYDNIKVDVRDGTLGWPEHGPYDAILVAAAAPGTIPPALVAQLAPGGRLVAPRGDSPLTQELVRLRKLDDGSIEEERLGEVRFVPLIGDQGWRESDEGGQS